MGQAPGGGAGEAAEKMCFIFLFAKRPGTPAASMPNEVPQRERLVLLQARIGENATWISQSMVGRIERILMKDSRARIQRNCVDVLRTTA
jgi:tRNA A37 methylthiotransferase MiaB